MLGGTAVSTDWLGGVGERRWIGERFDFGRGRAVLGTKGVVVPLMVSLVGCYPCRVGSCLTWRVGYICILLLPCH